MLEVILHTAKGPELVILSEAEISTLICLGAQATLAVDFCVMLRLLEVVASI